MSLSEAARTLKVNRQYLKGYADCQGIELHPAPPNALLMSRDDLERLRSRLGKPEPDAVAAAPRL